MTQDEALAILKTGLNVFLTGEPGSGKTHTINRYIQWLRERSVEPSVTASTGIAATHVNGMTVHSWSGIGINRDITDYDIEMIMGREKTAKRIVEAKVLIIEEVSMLDGRTLDSVDRVLRSLRRPVMQSEQPFGGLQVIFVGDFFQLPPVSRGERAQFAFSSYAWKEANPVTCYLSEQHRQEDDAFLELLTALRLGTFDDVHRETLRSRIGQKPKKTIATRLYTHNANVDQVNQQSLDGIKGKSRLFQMTSRGSKHLVDSLKQQCLSPEALELKEGAAVMCTRNNFEAGYVNGTLGIVENFSAAGNPVIRTTSGRVLEIEPAEWAIQDGAKVLARINQVPLRLAWAITVHKSQGMSLDAAVIDLSQAFEYGQGYVAISRVRSLEGLFLEGFNDRALELHPNVVAADEYFRKYSAAARKKFATLSDEEKAKLENNFLRAVGAKDPSSRAKLATGQERTDGKKAFDVLREKYPNLGRPWSKDDDALLTKMFKEKRESAEIATHFGRRASAIQARLDHLGLIPDPWAHKKKEKQK